VFTITRPETERTALAGATRAATAINARSSANTLNLDAATVTRPAWTRDRIPIRTMPPIESAAAVRVDRFVIQPHPREGIVYVAPLEASLLNFSLTVRRSVLPDRGVAITGGSASFTISTYATEPLTSIARRRNDWNAALTRNAMGDREWSFRAQPRGGLSISLELPDGVAAAAPLIATSPLAGVATVSVELTESGTLMWKSALEQGAGASIAGILHISSSSLAADGIVMRVDRRSLDTPLGTLLAGRGAADIRTVDPQQTVVGKLIVVTNDLVQKITVGLRPNAGLAPATDTFGSEGGVLEVPVSTADVDSVAIDWTTQVTFAPLGWPPVPASGRLSSSNTWTDMIKPDSWIATYTLMVIPVDDRGHAQPLDAAAGTTQLQGVLNFTAPYVSNGLLNSSFEAEYLRPFNMALPRYPGQPFGDVVLTVFATRNGVGGMKSRKLQADEVNAVVLVYPDGRVDIRTGLDALPESSSAAGVLRMMESL
jgi:hypothetical protein